MLTSRTLFLPSLLIMGTVIWASAPSLQAQDIAAGDDYALARCDANRVLVWGDNLWGQFGDGTGGDVAFPHQISAYSDIRMVAAGGAHTLILTNSGLILSSGFNSEGQLGDGTNTSRNVADTIPSISSVTAVACGQSNSLALRSDSTVWAWGTHLGNGTDDHSAVPTMVPGLGHIRVIARGFSNALVLDRDSMIWTWGANNHGQLGDGTNTHHNAPIMISSLSAVVSVAGGFGHSLALRSDGSVWAWGMNEYGQVGNGTNSDMNVPVQIAPLTDIVAIAAGEFHSMALKNDGTVWAWGRNWYGALGDGTSEHRNTPVQVASLSDAVSIAAGDGFSMARRSNNALLAWGRNYHGQLGNGTFTDSPVPLPLLGVCNPLVCIPSQLTTLVDPVISCGATNLKFDGTSTIAATEVPSANKYQFRFTNITGQPAYSRNIAWPTRSFTLKKWYTNPLKAGRTYDVMVRTSFDFGATWCAWGPPCTVKISWSPMTPATEPRDMDAVWTGAPELSLYPNPTKGDELNITLSEMDPQLTSVSLDITDLFGKRVMTSTLAVQDGGLNIVLPLTRDLADGLYVVTITAGDQVFNARLIIAR